MHAASSACEFMGGLSGLLPSRYVGRIGRSHPSDLIYGRAFIAGFVPISIGLRAIDPWDCVCRSRFAFAAPQCAGLPIFRTASVRPIDRVGPIGSLGFRFELMC